MKSFVRIVFIFIVLTAAAGAWLFHDLQQYARRPLGEAQEKKLITVQPGQGFETVLETLKQAGLIRAPLRFKLVARLNRYDRQIRAGEYLLSPAMSPLDILRQMAGGKVLTRRMTIPEGYTLKQIAALAEELGIADRAAFLALATDPAFVRENGIEAQTLEGYLFPETYYFPGSATPEAVIRAMLKRFRQIFAPEWKKRAEEIGLSVHQVVTLASIVEKETGVAAERPRIASVFHNRLRRKMRLQSDPTVIYGIRNFDGNLTRKHLKARTAYNTYQISGLPPGPIANPGKAALEAVLYPEETRYLYFVAKGDRTHHFSTSLKEHNRAVRKYQLRRNRK
ncbi:hypothetical protein DENIS_0645 [Desulfonema ishimotonii]|uniref:Endolytic murein transglycosylase n=1 Tax=Desulfonema ishimotonii TaxID=45657 RepID=A0A401FRW1_9BACT|nr:endolytic transglycosylase MltG [Desulfonema ishimotonii]GBC59704.1 hypothetical protein DENIS_0645 [Desulfonema ishimotonii]